MMLNSPATELTTAATDALLGCLCLFPMAWLHKFRANHPWRTNVWLWVFGLLAAASFLGAAAHGLALSDAHRNALWQPLYLALGIDVALFVLGGVTDWRGEKTARRLLLPALVLPIAFYSLTRILEGNFLVFVVYEGVAMISSLSIYAVLAFRRHLPGAALMAAGIALTLVAAGLQASSLGFTFIWPFDHNGLFHLLQMPALLAIGFGLRAGFRLRP